MTISIQLVARGDLNTPIENSWALSCPPTTNPPCQYSRPKESNDIMTSRWHQQGGQVLGPYVKQFSRERADRCTHTHRQNDQFYTLNHWCWRELCLCHKSSPHMMPSLSTTHGMITMFTHSLTLGVKTLRPVNAAFSTQMEPERPPSMYYLLGPIFRLNCITVSEEHFSEHEVHVNCYSMLQVLTKFRCRFPSTVTYLVNSIKCWFCWV